MTKRGSMLVVIAIITIVIALIVGLVFPKITEVYAKGGITLKTAAARDIALIIDTIYAYPYDMKIVYDYDLSNFVVEISQNRVRIYDTLFVSVEGNKYIRGTDPIYTEYSFVPVNDNLNYILDRPVGINFTKGGGRLTIVWGKREMLVLEDENV